MHKRILQVVQEALRSSRKVRITFRQEATEDVVCLLEMRNRGVISIPSKWDIVFLSISHSHQWGDDANRTVVIYFTDKFDEKWFVSRMHRILENIEVVN